VILQTYTPTEIVIKVRSAKGGFVLVNDEYDPDWSVEVDGKPAVLLLADYIMRAVAVPPGESVVTMRYATHYDLLGCRVSARAMNCVSDFAMIGAWIVAGIALRRRATKEVQSAA
jgi:uncharacterized membrane protein YfhO